MKIFDDMKLIYQNILDVNHRISLKKTIEDIKYRASLIESFNDSLSCLNDMASHMFDVDLAVKKDLQKSKNDKIMHVWKIIKNNGEKNG